MTIQIKELTEQELVLDVSGLINELNAEDFYVRVRGEREKAPGRKLVLDFDQVTYLSSAGLRSLLRLQKAAPISLINVPAEIMEILEMTKFSSIMDTHRRIRAVSLKGAEFVGRGANGEVYRLPDETVIKLFMPGAPLADINREIELAQQSMVQGIPTAIAYETVKADDRFGAVYEAVNSSTLSQLIGANPDRFEEFAAKYVELLKRFHSTHVQPDTFPNMKDIYHGYIETSRDWYTPQELSVLHRVVDSVPDRDTLVHGDYHANNIMVMDDELLMIDMGDVSYGHPVFDFLATAATQANLVDLDPAYAEAHTRMPVDMIRRLWKYLMIHYFDQMSPDEIPATEQQIRLFSKLKVAVAPAVARGIPQALLEASVNDAKQNFLTRADELIGALRW